MVNVKIISCQYPGVRLSPRTRENTTLDDLGHTRALLHIVISMAYTDLSSPYFGGEDESEPENNGGHSSCSFFDERDDSPESPRHASVPKDRYDFDSFFDALAPDDRRKDLEKLGSMYHHEDDNPLRASSGRNSLHYRSNSHRLHPAKVLRLSEDLNSPYCDEDDLSKNQDETQSDDDDSHSGRSGEPYNDGSDCHASPSPLSAEDANTMDSYKEDDQRSLARKSDQLLSKEGRSHLKTEHVEHVAAQKLPLQSAVAMQIVSPEEIPKTPPPPYIEDEEANSDLDENHSTAPPTYNDQHNTISTEYSTLKSLFPPVEPNVLSPHKKTRSAPNVFEHMRKPTDVRSNNRSHRRSRTAFVLNDDESGELPSVHSFTHSSDASAELSR